MSGPGELPSQQSGRIVGREAGLARLRGLVEPVPRAGQVLLVTGEAGMGKTVLLADAAGRARSGGIAQERGRAAGGGQAELRVLVQGQPDVIDVMGEGTHDRGRVVLVLVGTRPRCGCARRARAARADLERRAGCYTAAREYYEQAIALARSPAERVSFERRIESMEIS